MAQNSLILGEFQILSNSKNAALLSCFFSGVTSVKSDSWSGEKFTSLAKVCLCLKIRVRFSGFKVKNQNLGNKIKSLTDCR